MQDKITQGDSLKACWVSPLHSQVQETRLMKEKVLSNTFVFLRSHNYQKEGYREILFRLLGLALVLLCASEEY